MDTAELAKFIKGRRSIRSFQNKPVPESLLLQAIELATWAPNGANAQNWHFFVVLDKTIISLIADAVQAAMKTMMSWPEMANAGLPGPRPGASIPGGLPPGGPPREDALRSAPALIAIATHRIANPMGEAIAKRAANDPQAKQMLEGLQLVASHVQSTSAAVAYLVLVLHQMGLGSVWMTGPMQAKAQIERIIKVTSGMDIVTLVAVGYPAESPTKDRKPVSEVCQVIK